jgi:hypothetical protein
VVSLPGEPAPAAGLYLNQPRCTFFKHLARGGSGETCRFLAVQGAGNGWLFCADAPVSLEPLAEDLRKAEAAQGPAAPGPSWSALAAGGGSSVVVSPQSGTLLSEQQVLRVVKVWTSARQAPRRRFRKRKEVALFLVGLLFLGLLAWSFPALRGSGDRGFTPDPEPRQPAEGGPRNLHILAVGISEYPERRLRLQHAAQDARDLVAVLKRQQGPLFQEVVPRILTDGEATHDALLEELGALARRAHPNDLAVVILEGHGLNLHGDHFYFLPYDCEPEKVQSRGIAWSQMGEILESLPCTVLVILDTCHSGTATQRLPREVSGAKNRAVIVLAACLGAGRAQERSVWGHGALTLALLEALEGQRLYAGKAGTELPRPNERGEITASEVIHYVERRVRDLVGESQAVTASNTGNVDLLGIPLASRPAAGQ